MLRIENKTELLLGMATLANLAVVAWYFLVKPEQPLRCPAPSQTMHTEILQELKDELFFRSLRDEHRQISPGGVSAAAPLLLLRFSFQNCDLCINSALGELQQMEKDLGRSNVMLAGTFLSPREFQIFDQSGKTAGFECHNVPEKYFGLHAEQDASLPFFFVLFPDGGIRHVFFPMKEDAGRTRKYLRAIQERYFTKPAQ